MIKFLTRLFRILLVLLLLVIGVIGFTVSTEIGLSNLLKLTNRFAPDLISYERISGRLIGPLLIENLRYQDDVIDLQLRRAEFNWFPQQLLSAKMIIEQLHLEGITLRLSPPSAEQPEETSAEPLTLPDISLPLAVAINDLEVADVRVFLPEATQPIIVNKLQLQAQTNENQLEVQQLYVTTPEASVNLNGQTTPIGNYPLDLELSWSFHQEQLGDLKGNGRLSGALTEQIQIQHQTTGTIPSTLTGAVSNVLIKPAWNTKLTLAITELERFVPDLPGTGLNAELQTQGTLDAFQLSTQIDSQIPELGPVNARLVANGSMSALHIEQLTLNASEHPLAFELSADIDIPQQTLSAQGNWQDLAWPLSGEPQFMSPRGELNATGSPKDYQLTLNTDVSGPQLGALNLALSANGSDQALTVSNLLLTAPQRELQFDAQARVNFSDLDFAASGKWQQLVWPLQPQEVAMVESAQGNFTAQGTPKNYRFTLTTDVKGKDIPQGQWQISGQGSDQAIQQLDLQGQTLSGQLNGQISARWQPNVNWQVSVQGESINPGVQWPDVPGNLNFKLRSEGDLAQNSIADSSAYVDDIVKSPDQTQSPGINASLQLDELSGTLTNQDVQGNAKLALQDQDLTVESLQLKAGAATLQAQGFVGDDLNLEWDLQIPALKGLLPGAQGAVSGSGRLAGSRTKPNAELELKLANLAYGENKIDNLQGTASIDISGTKPSVLDFKGSGLSTAGQSWRSLNLSGGGMPEQHELKVALQGELGQFALALAGGLDGETWQGRLNQLSADKTLAGDWALDKPLPLSLSQQQVTAEQSCLSSQPTRVCLQGQWSQTQGANAKITFSDLNISRFREFLPPELTINNQVAGEVTASSSADGALTANAEIKLAGGDIKYLVEGQTLTIGLRDSVLRAVSDGRNADTELRVDLGSLGQLSSNIKLEDFSGQQAISGTVKAEINDLKPVSVFAPQLQSIAGKVAADLNLSGALPVPVLRGSIELLDAAVSVPQASINIEDIDVKIASDGNGPLLLSGSARSGPGSLELSGQLQAFEKKLEIAIKGDRFQAMNSYEIQALISPDMRITLDQSRVDVDGEVLIPTAYISPPGGSAGGVSVSQDVVVVKGTDDEPTPAATHTDIFAKVRVILGEDVQVEAAGFKGQLQGDLLIEQTPQLAPRGTGSVEVAAGDYEIYGQELSIEHGRVLFSGGPIDNPGLDLRISRTHDEVTVGAQVRGSLREPRLELFSLPSMPDSSIISYLVFGRAPTGNNASESELLYKAATALGASGGNALTKGVSEALGLDELSFEGGESLDDASLVVGKYLSPDLYVSYGLGLFEAVNTFNLRYKISERLSFESSTSGDNSSADIIYTIER